MDKQPPIPTDDNENNDNLPQIPNDISGLEENIQDNESQRRRAIQKALEAAKSAATQEERDFWIVKAMKFGDILDEYRGKYPELFPDDNPEE